MILKVVSLFLIFIAVLGMFGKLRLPGADLRKRLGSKAPGKCKSCGRYMIGGGTCDCGKGSG